MAVGLFDACIYIFDDCKLCSAQSRSLDVKAMDFDEIPDLADVLFSSILKQW